MTVLRSRRLAGLAGGTALTLTLAGIAVAVSAPAQARVTRTLIQSHVVASWGLNAEGELGDGTTMSRWQFGDVRAGNDVVQVAAGVDHAMAVRSDGTVWAWEFNGHGELGDRTTTRKAVTDHEAAPTRVAVLNGVIKISAGFDFALALRSDGIVFAWGHGQRGQLGNGGTADSAVPAKIAGLSRVTGLPAYVAGISAGTGFAAVLGADGSVWDWGANAIGELGMAPDSLTVTRPVNAMAGGSGITQLSAGGTHMLALKSDGTVLAWGYNAYGQLGRSRTRPASPVRCISRGVRDSVLAHRRPVRP